MTINKCEYASRTSGMNFWQPLAVGTGNQCEQSKSTTPDLGDILKVTLPVARNTN